MTTVLVTGPRCAGVSSLVAELTTRLPEVIFTESGEQPDAVVFVVSAIAAVTASDCDLIQQASERADLVVGAVSKIDAHRRWREVLAANRTLLAERGDRHRDMPWIGVAAAPELGAPSVDDLVAVLTEGLAQPDLARRNIVRINTCRAGSLRDRRREIVRSGRSAPTARAGVQEARVRLIFLIRTRCAEIASSLRQAAGEVPRHGAKEFEARVRAAGEAFVGEIDDETQRELDAVAAALSARAPDIEASLRLPEISRPRRQPDRLQRRLSTVLGAGFGIGVALAASRLIVGVVPGSDVAGLIAGGLLGVLAATWVIRARALLHSRAALDRWVGEVVAALRARGEEMVTGRLLAAEAAFTEQLGARDEARAARLRAIDAELRQLERRN